jgi:uncharacterized protein YpiB (UPF0302 family)
MAFTGQRRALEDIDANEEPTKEERLLPQSAKSIHTYLINRLSDALSPKSKIFDAELKRTWSRLDRRTRQEIKEECARQIKEDRDARDRARMVQMSWEDQLAVLRSLAMSRALPASIDEDAPLRNMER